MILIKDKVNCCGCSACEQICPKKCIHFRIDTEGFWYPEVDTDSCIDCHLCETACPLQERIVTDNTVMQTYVGYSLQEDIRLASSSGGIFSLLAEVFLEQRGKVYGAAFDENFMVHHISISSKEEMYRLQGSKYLQSRIEQTFLQVKQDLLSGKPVLFSGTACQVAGLKSFLSKPYPNLLTVDVLCHGVPSPLVWERYLRNMEQQHGSKVKEISFRGKAHGWKRYEMKLQFTNGKVHAVPHSDDPYMKLFLNNICLRPSCHHCQFKALNRPSDLTLGDCWGVENSMSEMYDDKGTSVILVHTDVGKKYFDAIAPRIKCGKAQTDTVLPPTADSRKSVREHPNRRRFFSQLKREKSLNTMLLLLNISMYRRVRNQLSKSLKRFIKNKSQN